MVVPPMQHTHTHKHTALLTAVVAAVQPYVNQKTMMRVNRAFELVGMLLLAHAWAFYLPESGKFEKAKEQFSNWDDLRTHVGTYDLPPAGVCHNATGACLSNGSYLCLSGQVVLLTDRCDGIDDCTDGTDELMCHLSPTHWRAATNPDVHRRRFHAMFAAPTCNGCACPIGGDSEVSVGNPYFEMALGAKMTPEFSDAPPKGRRCHQEMTTSMMIRLYKKSGFCRKAICCIRQSGCVRCNSTDVTPTPGKCHEKLESVAAEASATPAPSPP